jgi:sugar O-acyltransferase (sialic acid O-acetyltransferase NeuD family)
MKERFVILGAKNPEIMRLYESCKEANPSLELVGFLDNDPAKHGREFLGYPIFGGHEALASAELNGIGVLNAITGDARVRKATTEQVLQYDVHLINLIHPSVDLRYVKLGAGLYIQEAVVIQSDVTLADNVSIHIGTMVGHETMVGDSTFIAHGCAISGSVTIGEQVFVGVGSIVLPRLKIGDGSVIGGGAVVIDDVEPNSVMVGNPAKVLRKLE